MAPKFHFLGMVLLNTCPKTLKEIFWTWSSLIRIGRGNSEAEFADSQCLEEAHGDGASTQERLRKLTLLCQLV